MNLIDGDGAAEVVSEFVSFVSSLRAAGVHRFHVLAHSLGARLIFSALPALQRLLHPSHSPVHMSPEEKMRLCTVVLMNPDASLARFLASDFYALRRLLFNREKALGKHPFSLARPRDSFLPEKSRQGVPPMLLSGRTRKMIYAARASANTLWNREAAGAACGEPLDMDVIDTSWMDANVHAMRHNIFNVNRWVVDDLREIFNTRKRAKLRNNRLVHRSGNVWSFLAAPKHIVNS
ncbi:MAG: hypothetical protein SGPRY_002347 [Prymnesium sp.]